MGLDGSKGRICITIFRNLLLSAAQVVLHTNPKSLWGNSRVLNEVPRTQGQRLHINKGTKETYSENDCKMLEVSSEG